jgi:integrase
LFYIDLLNSLYGFRYKIRYKIDLSGNRIPQGKATFTIKTASLDEAVALGFENRIDILKNYELSKDKPKSGNAFYKMLNDYYADSSRYLEDDAVNNRREVVYKSRIAAQTFIKDDLIPYLQEIKIKHISEITTSVTTSVYSGFKIYLQAKGIKDKTINNRLNFLLRIFNYHIRNGLLEKTPYTKGTSLIKMSGKQETEDAEILQVEKLKGIFPGQEVIDPVILIRFMNFYPKGFPKLTRNEQEIIFSGYIMPFTLCVLGLNTGMRNSEIARIKREDFIGVHEKETFLLKVWNKKTEYFNKTSESKYRKIPLHPYTIEAVRIYIRKREELFEAIGDADFLFGNAVVDKDTKEDDGFLHSRVFDKAVLLILCLIKYKARFSDFFSTEKELLGRIGNIKALQEELKEIKMPGKAFLFIHSERHSGQC